MHYGNINVVYSGLHMHVVVLWLTPVLLSQLISANWTLSWRSAKTKRRPRCTWPTSSPTCSKMATSRTSGISLGTSSCIESTTRKTRALAKWVRANGTTSPHLSKSMLNSVFLLCYLQKKADFKTSKIELTDLDHGESYCFTVQAYIPSRSYDKQLGELSSTQCSDDSNKSIFTGESRGFVDGVVKVLSLGNKTLGISHDVDPLFAL